MLRLFENEPFRKGWIAQNMAQVFLFFFQNILIYQESNVMIQVPLQPNSKDCGCFAVYFAKKFFENPDSTLTLIKVCLFISSSYLNL